MMIARFTCEILRAIPVGDIRVQVRLARPGRSVELLEATASADGREVARAAAWRVLRTGSPPVEPRLPSPPGLPDEPPVLPPAELDGRVQIGHRVAARPRKPRRCGARHLVDTDALPARAG